MCHNTIELHITGFSGNQPVKIINPKDMGRPYKLEAKDVTLNLVKDRHGPNVKQDLGI